MAFLGCEAPCLSPFGIIFPLRIRCKIDCFLRRRNKATAHRVF